MSQGDGGGTTVAATPGGPPGVTSPLPRDDLYTWATDANGNSYVGTLVTTLNQGASFAAATKTVQTQDGYGNVLTSQVYDYNSLSSPARSYTNAYLYYGNSNYSSRYIYNRLATVRSRSNRMDPACTTATITRFSVKRFCPLSSLARFGPRRNSRNRVERDRISGETVTYAYDALKRLSGASSSASWSAGAGGHRPSI